MGNTTSNGHRCEYGEVVSGFFCVLTPWPNSAGRRGILPLQWYAIFIDIYITVEIVEQVSNTMQGSTGPVGIDTAAW